MLRKRLCFDGFVPGWRTQRFYRVRNPVHIKINRNKGSSVCFTYDTVVLSVIYYSSVLAKAHHRIDALSGFLHCLLCKGNALALPIYHAVIDITKCRHLHVVAYTILRQRIETLLRVCKLKV